MPRLALICLMLTGLSGCVTSQPSTATDRLKPGAVECARQLADGDQASARAACMAHLATLEAALFKRPMVIAYKMQWLSWQIANRQRLLPWIGLPNILCNEGLVPEFLQEQVQPEALAKAVLQWLDDPMAVAKIQQRFTALHHQLRQDMPTLATHAIQKVLAA